MAPSSAIAPFKFEIVICAKQSLAQSGTFDRIVTDIVDVSQGRAELCEMLATVNVGLYMYRTAASPS
jgi:hypothetical protein